MEENLTSEQLRVSQLENEIEELRRENEELKLINNKLGYSTSFLAEFHASRGEKAEFCNKIDGARNTKETVKIYEKYRKNNLNDSLEDDLSDFQWLPEFKGNLRHYLAVSLGYDIVSDIRDELVVVANYFALENKIRSTPDNSLRAPMTDKLLEDRPATVAALDKIINIINSFN